jgi:hypothetical protein
VPAQLRSVLTQAHRQVAPVLRYFLIAGTNESGVASFASRRGG